MEDFLEIGSKKITNRLFLGTGKFGDNNLVKAVLAACGSQVVTVALRRINSGDSDDDILAAIPKDCIIMANTSGARTAQEAVRIARLAKAAGCGNWIKIEVINDNKYLLPDNQETIEATKILVDEGFVALPYMNPDLIAARKLKQAGASAIMPLGSPIGSNRGFQTQELVRIMVKEIALPIIVDAGLAWPSQAALCMELGCSAVLVNTAIATAKDPVSMAKAFSDAVFAGRSAFFAASNYSQETASASSPLTGFIRKD